MKEYLIINLFIYYYKQKIYLKRYISKKNIFWLQIARDGHIAMLLIAHITYLRIEIILIETKKRLLLRRCKTPWSAREIALAALSAERETHL